VKLAAPALALTLLAASAVPALACTPAVGWNAEKQRDYEDGLLRQADVFYRGVIDSVRTEPLGLPVVTIRWTRTLMGDGAPRTLVIDYWGACPLPNLIDVEGIDSVAGSGPHLRPGWGVTVIGRREDLTDRPDRLFVLIDGEPTTADIVARFQHLRLGWRQPEQKQSS